MGISKTGLPGALILTPRRFGDERRWFSENRNRRASLGAGADIGDVNANAGPIAAAQICNLIRASRTQTNSLGSRI